MTSSADIFLLRPAAINDIDEIMDIIMQSREILRRDNIPQWQDEAGAPTRDEFLATIDKQQTYVLVSRENGAIAALANLVPGPDPSYAEITKGAWHYPDVPYIAIHRVAASPAFAGRHIGVRLISALLGRISHLGYRQARIDTHEKNGRMRHIISGAGFRFAGRIYVKGRKNDPRRAYDILLS